MIRTVVKKDTSGVEVYVFVLQNDYKKIKEK